jgi:hypothetical protein
MLMTVTVSSLQQAAPLALALSRCRFLGLWQRQYSTAELQV